ncbi:SH3 domain-containing protein [Pseudoduganella lutea]|uniref:SH3 domain-containing protein n=1 Tax=Pseudoduganella lutea TaxID=321985 RepID=A0A4P6L5Z4_9BURK|nr:SH3 domain-containing protein [Pseudoduganella lutea]QBE66894.1 SH3 domain-containing protein [Pseudoduganella lutea]
MSFTDYHGIAAYGLALAFTLVLAAFLTPARWWRRPTARGVAILGTGTWAFGALLLHLVAPPMAGAVQTDVPMQQAASSLPANVPAAGQPYRVHRDLNVRDAAGVGAARMAVVPAGAVVTPTGARHGDWWQIRYDGAGSAQATRTGWASSLWLRSAAEQ